MVVIPAQLYAVENIYEKMDFYHPKKELEKVYDNFKQICNILRTNFKILRMQILDFLIFKRFTVYTYSICKFQCI